MKVYYKVAEDNNSKSKSVMLNAIVNRFSGDVKKALKGFFTNHQKQTEQFIVEKFEKAKYKVMWVLRGLEKEIKAEGGIIIINEQFQIELNNFSEELADKIRRLIDKSY